MEVLECLLETAETSFMLESKQGAEADECAMNGELHAKGELAFDRSTTPCRRCMSGKLQ
jgi:hypothetical protein